MQHCVGLGGVSVISVVSVMSISAMLDVIFYWSGILIQACVAGGGVF